jgi:hypothetical protein
MISSVTETLPVRVCATGQNTIQGLTEIFEQHCQVAIAERQPVLSIDRYLFAVANHMGDGFRVSLNAGDSLPLHLLPASPGREDFAADIAFLVEVYCDLLGCPAIGLRLEVLNRAMCPRFHVDHTGIRLLCTYRGPGTEWLEDTAADRSKLGPVSAGICDENSGIILNPAGIHRVEPYAITLLKGSRWQGNAGQGIVHRSPAVPADEAPRVVLALDTLW